MPRTLNLHCSNKDLAMGFDLVQPVVGGARRTVHLSDERLAGVFHQNRFVLNRGPRQVEGIPIPHQLVHLDDDVFLQVQQLVNANHALGTGVLKEMEIVTPVYLDLLTKTGNCLRSESRSKRKSFPPINLKE